MRPSSRLASAIALIFGVLVYGTSAQSSPEDTPVSSTNRLSLGIEFTGRMYGYYRIPYQSKPDLQPVISFLQDPTRIAPPARLLLGMGDNFGPVFGARIQEEGAPDSPCHVLPAKQPPPENIFKTEQRLVNEADCDSVANFLEQAGYRAVVPGREDFLYGAGWLRNIGLLLKNDTNTANNDRKTTLLAANLRIVQDKPAKLAIAALVQCGTLFGDYSSTAKTQLCSSKGDDLSTGNTLVPEKFRLLKEFDTWLQDPSRYAELTELNSHVVSPSGSINDRFKLMELTTRRQLLLRDLIETLSLALPNCSLYGPIDKNATAPELQDKIQPLLRDYKEGELPTLAWQDIKLPEVRTAQDLCGINGFSKMGTATETEFAQTLGRFVRSLNSAMDTEAVFEKQVRDGFKNSQKTRGAATTDGRTTIEPALLDKQGTRMLEDARSALLLAIAEEQRDVGYTEARVKGQDGNDIQVLIVGIVGTEPMQTIQDTSLSLTLCSSASTTLAPCAPANLGAVGSTGKFKFKVKVADPLQTLETVLRAAQTHHGGKYDLTILMAQMPRTETDELVARLRSDAFRVPTSDSPGPAPWLDLAISEAQQDHAAQPNWKLTYELVSSDSVPAVIPVMTPKSAYDTRTRQLVRPLVLANMTLAGNRRSILIPQFPPNYSLPPATDTTVTLLSQLKRFPIDQSCSAIQRLEAREHCNLAVMQAILALLAVHGNADLAALERRDLFLDELAPQYNQYEMCLAPMQNPSLTPDGLADCKLRVALARVLWEGDEASRIMVTGKDIGGALGKAQTYSDNQSSLASTDISQQWLQTAGVVTTINGGPLSPVEFSVQSSSDCHDPEEETKPTAGGTRMYCVNGMPLQPDHGYWVITSRHLATEKVEYGLSGSNPGDYLETTKSPSLLVDNVLETSKQITSDYLKDWDSARQQARIFHIDEGKIVVGYNLQHPIGGSANIINRFQGVSDATASSAGSANLDLEQKQRTDWEFKSFAFGVQDDAEFDRQVQDNLTGKFVNGNFTKNLLTAGPFLQRELPFRITPWQKGSNRWFTSQHDSKALPRWLLVFAPAQFQTQLTGSHLNFGADAGQSQVSFLARRTYGLGERFGIRQEFDGGAPWFPMKGSYFEAGGQFVQQKDVLSSLTFSIPGMPPIVCLANGAQSFANCAPSPKVLTADSSISGQYASTNQYGWYWDMHYQWGMFGKIYDKSAYRATLSFDSKGDFFKNRGPNHAFSTQTWYDAPASVALAFPVFRNISFAPTYTAYFYGNQVAQNSLLVNTFSVNLRWYLDRDSRVPFVWPAFLFKGPASADETQAKSK